MGLVILKPGQHISRYMRKRAPVIAFIVVAAGVAWLIFTWRPPVGGADAKQNVLPPETKRILDSGGRFVLLSIDPKPIVLQPSNSPPREGFHNYPVLGKTEIRDPKQ